MSRPFILTATIPEPVNSWAEGLRQEHFPPERNHLHAHVSLFHAFAPSLREELASYLPQAVAEYAPPKGRITGLINFGKGTAIRLEAPELKAIRAQIAERFHGSLTEQDLHEPRLHITVQNKVSKEEARELQAALEPKLAPWIERGAFAFPGLELHLYEGGPWTKLRDLPFRGKARP
ncbi:2'-5' RNA ligase family protein [Erythrobacter sp.]|uniref:2'-5' RNA ligase family protein n=1 Tax=Erythrobacter sp. TaxID=1042 RepID=UPI003C72CB8E